MVAAFERGGLVCEVGGDGTGLTSAQAADFAHDLHAEFPAAVVAILQSRKSWLGGWPWQSS